MNRCDTPNCEREAIPDGRWCHDCTVVVWRTGRPPELPAKFEPAWLKRARKQPHGLARDETGRAA